MKVSDAKRYLEDAWFRVLNSEPFYGIKMFDLTVIETEKITTMATDGKRLLFNPIFTLNLSKIWCETVLIHECMHVCLKHHIFMARFHLEQGSNFDPMLFNYAADAELNWMIKDMGRSLPDQCIYESRFHGKTVNEIYPIIYAEKQRENAQQRQDQSGDGDKKSQESGSGSVGNEGKKDTENGKGKTQNDSANDHDDNCDDDSSDSDCSSNRNESENSDDSLPENVGNGRDNDDDDLRNSDDGNENNSNSDSVGNDQSDSKGNDPCSVPSDADSFGSIGGIMLPTNEDGDDLEEWEIDELEKEVNAEINIASKMAGKRGCGNQSIVDNIVSRLKAIPVDWSEEVAELLTELIERDVTYTKPRECYVPFDIYEPDIDYEMTGKIAFFVDSSGSVNKDMFAEQMAKLNEILLQLPFLEFKVIYFHHNVWKVEDYDSDDVPLKLYSRTPGGTDYVPPFKTLDESEFDADVIIVLTDLYCNSYPRVEPDCPVLWLLCRSHYGGKEVTPFGKVIDIFNT